MEELKPVIIKEGDTLTPEQRKVLEDALRRCNACKHSNFANRSCCYDSENPVQLNTYTGATGYIVLIKPRGCENYEWKGRQDGE